MVARKCWSHKYFDKKVDGKYHCIFGCGKSYKESATKFKNHLLNQCKNIEPEARSEINKLALKKRNIENSTRISIIQQIDQNEQRELDILLIRALISGKVTAAFLGNPFFKQFIAKLRPSYKLPSLNSKFSNKVRV